MSEYIDRGALLKDIAESVVFSVRNAPSAEMRGANKIMERIKCASAADVVEVKHGRWEDATWNNCWQTMTATCSNCHERGEVRVKRNECGEIVINSPCCPNCGAKMDGE